MTHAPWAPSLPKGIQPIYERLISALQSDIQSGTLPEGARLPPHRDLAHRLGISVGSVTRAYTEAERRGLISAHVGRGSFVKGRQPTLPDIAPRPRIKPELLSARTIDLRCNAPAPVDILPELNAALTALMRDDSLEAALQYLHGPGLPEIRASGARWLQRRHGFDAHPDTIIQCNGGQHGISLAFSAFCEPGGVILCESSTFYGARMAADHLGMTLHGVAMDDEGLLPEALERAAMETGSRVLFTIPTLQNPTTRTLSAPRRAAIAAIARKHDLIILEDDAYHAYGDGLPAIARYAPERTLYLASISKNICPGLRLAFLTVPEGMPRDRLMRGVRAFGYCPPALGALVFMRWEQTQRADAIADAVQAESAARLLLAQDVLGARMAMPGATRCAHIWLPLSALDAERVCNRALHAGVELTLPDTYATAANADTGLRLCIGAPSSREELTHALKIIATTLGEHGTRPMEGIV